MGSHEVVGPSDTKIFMAKWLQFRLFSAPPIYGPVTSILAVSAPHVTKCSIPILTSQSCSDSLSAVCLTGQVGAIYRPPKHPRTPDRPVNETSVKADR